MAFGFDFNNNGDDSFGRDVPQAPAPEPETPAEPDATAWSVPEPAPESMTLETDGEDAENKAPDRPARRRPSGPTRAAVEKVLQVRAALADDAFRSKLAELTGKSDDAALESALLNGLSGKSELTRAQVARIDSAASRAERPEVARALDELCGSESPLARTLAVLSGRLSEPAALLVALHDAQDDRDRMRLAVAADAHVVRDAVRLANLVGGLSLKTVGKSFDVAMDLAFAAGTLDVESVRGLE
ncbi:hypothetical protein [Bifidobacterium adolescentis]|uniref:hypothetical protein n=1 Tax=Bifidobacterium adolescentis TaxID=1680 RepID=UPI0022E2B8C6|nr:hypothetical protein [Bifidobacterium adolescentis]